MSESSPTAPATLHDVAREAGVSLATASRSLNGSTRRVNDDYRQRVIEAAARLRYTPNLSAQAVARGTTTTVALVVADLTDPYFSSIASGVIAEADRERLIVTMAATERDPERELDLVRRLRGQRPRVIVLAGSRPEVDETGAALAAELAAYEDAGGRVVLISRNELGFRTVRLGNRAGAEALARELLGLGYRRFAAITGADDLRTTSDRLDGFRAGITAGGGRLDDADVMRAALTRDGGYAGTRELIERGLDGVELVFAATDVMAIGALSAIRDAGLAPGRDLAVAGFDDIATARDVSPSLTTVHLPLDEIGCRALRLALDEAGGDASIEPLVVLRDSTPRRD
ncbi:LacI family DNA-binding transcriptional regulator [Agromyces silvae]|uniref:LacI family DNA-binding transcriptional regulator n=1 Tax=Agromyces silvae TaxID=3388266 RepID=UPI00280ACA63|nr:LacI family DNA-binding transcriptional regulator [Agromyces protaetiae]